MSLLRAAVPNFGGKYVEPFAGSACLYWALCPDRAIIADLNVDLIACYQQVRDNPAAVFSIYSAMRNSSEDYYLARIKFRTESDPVARAALFLYLNRFCFNGLYRTDRAGLFNVPYGGRRTGELPTLDMLDLYSKQLRLAELFCGDFDSIVRINTSEGDFVYLDPPFYTQQSRVFNEYTSKPFTQDDLDRLDRLLDFIDSIGAKFLVSYLRTPEIARIAEKWTGDGIQVLRRMSGFSHGRRRADEVIFGNFAWNLHAS